MHDAYAYQQWGLHRLLKESVIIDLKSCIISFFSKAILLDKIWKRGWGLTNKNTINYSILSSFYDFLLFCTKTITFLCITLL